MSRGFCLCRGTRSFAASKPAGSWGDAMVVKLSYRRRTCGVMIVSGVMFGIVCGERCV